MPRPEITVGWDIGGAHVKAALIEQGAQGAPVLVDVAQWACPLWQGLSHLQHAIDQALARWPSLQHAATAEHAITMTGEMVDLFAHREAGVVALAAALAGQLPGRLHCFTGARGWCAPAQAASRWAEIASANWWATAALAAQGAPVDGAVLVDIGSTTTDLIALRPGRVLTDSRSDVQRLASGELVYQGVVRTPLCALAPRVAFGGQVLNVMNEFFATTADVYRLTGELDAAHDQHPSADGAAKDEAASCQRLARMIGLDARDAPVAEWRTLAQVWRAAQADELHSQFERVRASAGLGPQAVVIGAGCGDFLAAALAARCGLGYRRFVSLFDSPPSSSLAGPVGVSVSPSAAPELQRWVQVGAPAVAVACLKATGWVGEGVTVVPWVNDMHQPA